MEAAYISTFAALAGTAIGGLTSFATSWTTQQAQARAQRLAAERESRAALFGRFLDEAAKTLFRCSAKSAGRYISGLISIYALTNRIRLMSIATSCRGRRHGVSHHRRCISCAEHYIGGNAGELDR